MRMAKIIEIFCTVGLHFVTLNERHSCILLLSALEERTFEKNLTYLDLKCRYDNDSLKNESIQKIEIPKTSISH